MDANFSINNNDLQKDNQGERHVEINTSLSDLPNDILQKIISNLSTKEAVSTSILSKRWVDQWKNVNKIDLKFEESTPEKRQHFLVFVNKLLVVCNISKLKMFSLSFEVGEDFSMVTKWLSFFVNPMIEELNLELGRVGEPLDLPNQFFTSNKLTRFQLSMKQVINLPSTINFENLETLTLKHVIFPNSYCTSQFFSGLPCMKELSLTDCNWDGVKSIIIKCPLLQKLFIRDWKDNDNEEEEHDHHHNEEAQVEELNDNDGEDEEHDHHGNEEVDVVELNDGVYVHDIVLQHLNYSYNNIPIMAKELLTFTYDGDIISDYSLFFTTSVTDAILEVHEQYNEIINASYFVYKFLKDLMTIKKLSISNFALEAIGQFSPFAVDLPTFFRLLDLHVISPSAMDLSCQGLQTLLKNSPILKEIKFEGVTLDENDGNVIGPLPTCFLTHLKVIKIYNFCANEGEVNAIKYLLHTTQVLDILHIQYNKSHFDSPEGSQELQTFFDQIDDFPKASRDCIIEIE